MMTPETAMRQATKTAAQYMDDAISYIDETFGDGHARNNPALLGAFIIAAALDFQTATTAGHVE